MPEQKNGNWLKLSLREVILVIVALATTVGFLLQSTVRSADYLRKQVLVNQSQIINMQEDIASNQKLICQSQIMLSKAQDRLVDILDRMDVRISNIEKRFDGR